MMPELLLVVGSKRSQKPKKRKILQPSGQSQNYVCESLQQKSPWKRHDDFFGC